VKKIRVIIVMLAALFLISQAACVAIYLYVRSAGGRYVVDDIGTIPPAYTCIVPGAAVYADGRVSDVLYDRMVKALDLFRAGKARTLLLSGDHSTFYYNEVRQMRDFMLRRGVPREALFLDHGGINTYSSMARARKVFLVDDCIVVTQRFHLPRALYIARKAGLRARGFPADRRRYLHRHRYAVREYFACVKAFLDVVMDRKPRLPGVTIPITGSVASGREAR